MLFNVKYFCKMRKSILFHRKFSFSGLQRYVIKKTKVSKKHFGSKKILPTYLVDSLVSNAITSGSPLLVSRFGTTETRVLLEYLNLVASRSNNLQTDSIERLFNLSGVFPPRQDIVQDFCRSLIQVASEIDLCGVRSANIEQDFWKSEDKVARLLSDSAGVFDIDHLSPLKSNISWLSSLEGKRVLIIHPFVDSIQSQYKKRQKLFTSDNWLPNFEMILMKPVQSLGMNYKGLGYRDWFSALEHMKEEIDSLKSDFDLGLIGAGAYGVFLGSFIKDLGKPAIHIGGALQLFFGIRGNRWESDPNFKKLSIDNSNWIFPAPHETPKSSDKVENSAYWKMQ
jgi:hypothetical protein